jgi:putative membrane protein
MKVLGKIILNILAVAVAAYIVPGVSATGWLTVAIVAVILGAVNFFVRPVLVILTLPITLVTLGLFLLVINALMILLVAWLVPGFAVAGFWSALLFSLMVSILNAFFNRLNNKERFS